MGRRPAETYHISRLPNIDVDSLSALFVDDERVTESVSELLQLLRVRIGPCIADNSMATALWSASIARVIVVGAPHEAGSLLVVPPTEAESLRMAESRFMLEKARFRLATIDVLSRIPVLKRFAVDVAEIYTDSLTTQVSRIVVVADWYDWFCPAGDGQRQPYSSRDALTYLERNVGVRFHRDVVVALRALTSGAYRDDDLEFA
jgi:hypothetical protein